MNIAKIHILVPFASMLWAGLTSSACQPGGRGAHTNGLGLKNHFAGYFDIGVAVSPKALATDEAALIQKEFNSITAENAMKMGPIHPKEDVFFWRDADSIVHFAGRNQMKVRGHTLCWHQQTPSWIFTDANGDTVSKDVLLARLKNHIAAVVGRYKGRIYAWDVVNEAISDSPAEFYRKSPWYRIVGEDYIAKAFEYAHEADPGALLFYNDYNETDPVKRDKIVRLIKGLQVRGVPIHGVGLQAHWSITEPDSGRLDSTLTQFSKLGIELHITELDISVYPKEHARRDRQPSDADTLFTAHREQQQREAYKRCFALFRKHKGAVRSVTFWNVSDRASWLDNFPVRGRKDYPLLFDRNLMPKNAYWDVVKF
jgi:endo-1,4-beta-xylanase